MFKQAKLICDDRNRYIVTLGVEYDSNGGMRETLECQNVVYLDLVYIFENMPSHVFKVWAFY